MKRIDIIFNKIKNIYPEGLSASDVANELFLARSNVSADLNKLSSISKIFKDDSTRPVKFYYIPEKDFKIDEIPKKIIEQNNLKSDLDKFVELNASMFKAIELFKAAVLYPPSGMNLMILGETGVGKSMMAGFIHSFAIESKTIKNNSPFIVFNCADYANNQQLLLAQIFGSKKGSYTGSSEDRVGLLEEANGGIIFFDEVHRLSPEGQEMLFTFMDKGVYRRLGDNQIRKAIVMIIVATTEDPETSLLATFVRRIPMIITIPSLRERSLDERFNLISLFIKNEATRLNKQIKISINAIRAFLGYKCINNVGQLKSDIKLSCAKAYANYVSGKKSDIEISSLDLPTYIREGLYLEVDHRALWNRLVRINDRLCIFDPVNENKILADEVSTINIYEVLDLRMEELKNRNISETDIYEQLKLDVNSYFSDYYEEMKISTKSLENLIDEKVLLLVGEILDFSQKKLNRKFSEKVYFAIAMHIANLVERLNKNKRIYNKNLNSIKNKHTIEFKTAIECLKIIESYIDKIVPLDEAGFLTIFFLMDEDTNVACKYLVSVIVVAHGKSTATSMALAANDLLGVNYAVGINANLDESPSSVLKKVKEYIYSLDTKSDILMLVDMGSLTNFATELEEEFNVNVKTIPLVSTLHVLEATRKAIMNRTLEEIYIETLNVNDYTSAVIGNDIFNTIKNNKKNNCLKSAIISICSSGEGTAKIIKKTLEDNLNFYKEKIEIITMNYEGQETTLKLLSKLEKEYCILCLVTNFNIKYNVPIFELEKVFSDSGLDDIQNLINIKYQSKSIESTLSNYVTNINISNALEISKKIIEKISLISGVEIDKSREVGILLHMVCMIERAVKNSCLNTFSNKEDFIKKNLTLYETIVDSTRELKDIYNVLFSEEEICYLTKLFF